jgi:nicotinamide mononucleotide (NMN) deamidase PncC
VTGIAGPSGGTEEKDVGLVFIGIYLNGRVIVKEYHFTGEREKIRGASVKTALD